MSSLPQLKERRHDFHDWKSLASIFQVRCFVIRVNLSHPRLSLFFYGLLLLFLGSFSVLS